MYVAMHFAAAAQVLLLLSCQRSEIKDQFRPSAIDLCAPIPASLSIFIIRQKPDSAHLPARFAPAKEN
jgi:hypothetical protein